MNEPIPLASNLLSPFCPPTDRTTTGRDLDEALDAWLADDFAHEDYLHVHSWSEATGAKSTDMEIVGVRS